MVDFQNNKLSSLYSRIIDDLSFWIIYLCTCDFTASLYETLISTVQLPPKTRQVLL